MSLDEPPILVNQAAKKRKRFRWEVAFVCACVLTVGIGLKQGLDLLNGDPFKLRHYGTREERTEYMLGLTNRTELIATLFDWAHSTNSDEPTDEARTAAQALIRHHPFYISTITNASNEKVGIEIRTLLPREMELESVFVAKEEGDLPAKYRHATQVDTNIFIWQTRMYR